MRPRVLSSFFAEFAQLSAIATRKDPKATADPHAIVPTSGYDDDFKETIMLIDQGVRTSARKESTPVFIPCQVEADTMDALSQQAAGNVPDAKIVVVTAYKDLERMRLIDPDTGECMVKVNDRLVSIRDRCMCVIRAIRTPPGLYVTQCLPSYGFGGRPDLLMFTLEDREQGAKGN